MKNSIFYVLFIGLILSSCKKEEPEILGSVNLTPTTSNLTYKQTVDIVPSFTQTGTAKDKQYSWKTSNDTIASVTTALGGIGRVTANRVGSTTITYVSTDGKLSATTTVNVDPRSRILGNNGTIYYKKGADKSLVLTQETGTINLGESTDTFIAYDRTPSTSDVVRVIRVIYQFDANNKLVATYAAIEDNAANRTSVQQYLEERFEMTSIIKNQMSFFKADVSPLKMYEKNTMIGAFIDNNPNTGLPTGLTYSLGVKIVDSSAM